LTRAVTLIIEEKASCPHPKALKKQGLVDIGEKHGRSS